MERMTLASASTRIYRSATIASMTRAALCSLLLATCAQADELPTLDCVIEPSEIVDVGSAVAGVLENVAFDRGDSVHKGEVVARLESGMEEAAEELARTRARLTTGVELRRTSAEFFARNQERTQSMTQQDAISRQQLDQLDTEARVADLQVRQEKDNRQMAMLEHRRALRALERRSIKSPIDGVVMDRFKSVGEYVEDSPVLRIAQLDPLFVETIVPVELMGKIRTGMRAQVTPAVPDHPPQMAVVGRIDRVADAASGTFGVRLIMQNPAGDAASGVRCALQFVAEPVPTRAGTTGTAGKTGVSVATGSPGTTKSTVTARPGKPARDNVDTATQAKLGAVQTQQSQRPRRVVKNRVPHAVKIRRANVQPVDNMTPDRVAAVPAVATVASQRVATVSAAATVVPKRIAAAVAVAAPATAAAASLPLQCFEAGPIADHATAQKLLASLTAKDTEAHLRDGSTVPPSAYMVLTPPMADLAAATAHTRRLAEAGLTDTQILRRGSYKLRISLGLYAKQIGARYRSDQIARLGFDTSVVPREPERAGAWIDVATRSAQDVKILRQMHSANGPADVNAVPCSVYQARLD